MTGAIWASGTITRFSSYGVAIREPSAARICDCWDSGVWVKSPGKESKRWTPSRAAAPVAATAGSTRAAPSSPMTTAVATRAASRLRMLAKFVARPPIASSVARPAPLRSMNWPEISALEQGTRLRRNGPTAALALPGPLWPHGWDEHPPPQPQWDSSGGSVLRPAGHVDDLARDIPGLFAGQERDHGRNVLRLTGATDRDLGRGFGQEVLERDVHPRGGLPDHGGGDEARSHGIGGHAEAAELDRKSLGETLHTGLGRGVVDLTAVSLRGRGGQVDDPAEAFGRHVRLDGLGHQERATQVDVHDGIPVLDRHLEDQVVADDAGVVDQDGRGAELDRDTFDGGLDLGGHADVDSHANGTAPGGGDR